MKKNNTVTGEEIRRLVRERLKTLSSGRRISLGSEGDFSREELIAEVDKQTPLGNTIIKIQLDYLRAMKEGLLLDDE